MGLRIGLDERDPRGLARRGIEVAERLSVDREQAAGRAVLGRHIGDRRAVGDRHRVQARAEELDEFADDALLSQHLRDCQHEVCRSDALAQFARQLEPDDFGQQHRERLAEHRGFRFDAADAPAEHGEAVDHRGVAVGPDQRIGIGGLDRLAVALFLGGPDGLREIFEIDLMADASARRHDGEIGKRLLAPLQEAVALLVLLIFALDVLPQRLRRSEIIDDHGMVDDEIDRHQRIDLVGIAAQRDHRIAHRRQIDYGGNAGEILHQHARGAERDLMLGLAPVVEPRRDGLDVFLLDRAAVLVAQQVFEHDLHRVRQSRDSGETMLLGGLQREILVGLRSDIQVFRAFETVEAGHAASPRNECGFGMTAL